MNARVVVVIWQSHVYRVKRKEDYSKAMSFPTYPLATVPSAPVWFTFHSAEDFCPVDAVWLLRLNYLGLRSRVWEVGFEPTCN